MSTHTAEASRAFEAAGEGGVVPAVRARALTRRYRRGTALDAVDLDLAAGRIHGLVGRNGAGKTTLLSLIAGHLHPTSGTVEVFGQAPVENPAVTRRTAFIRDRQRYAEDLRVEHVLRTAALVFPRWDEGLARRLVEDFELDPHAKAKKLSSGQRTSLGLVTGLASRAELTLLDEPYSGLDPVARALFYDRLLEDYAEHPRTVVISTHLIDEVAHLLDEVIFLDRGRVLSQDTAEGLAAQAYRVAGPGEAVDRLLADLQRRAPREHALVRREQVGATALAAVAGPRQDAEAPAAALGLDLEPVTLQEAMTILSGAGDRSGAVSEGAAS